MELYRYTLPRRFAHRWMAAQNAAASTPCLAVNVREEGDAFLLTAFVPGLQPDDLRIQVLQDYVSIEGKLQGSEDEYVLHELPVGPFRRELRLPVPLDAAKVEAKIEDGILSLRLPKAESARPRQIKISTK